jgi:hypothetical protein
MGQLLIKMEGQLRFLEKKCHNFWLTTLIEHSIRENVTGHVKMSQVPFLRIRIKPTEMLLLLQKLMF